MRLLSALLICLTSVAPAQAGATCRHEEFAGFFEWFSASADHQKIASADPLAFTTFQSMGSSMPARYREERKLEDVAWPVMPSSSDLGALGFKVRSRVESENRARVYADPADNRETYLIWMFEKDPCWTLTEVVDGTLTR